MWRVVIEKGVYVVIFNCSDEIRVYINSVTNNVQLGHVWQSCLILCHIIVIGQESGLVETCFD